MKFATIAFILCVAALLARLAGPRTEAQPKKEEIAVTGFVMDSKGAPIESTTILIVHSGKGRTIPLKTDDKGRYSAKVKNMDSFSITYDHSEAGSATVVKLSGTKDQNISIVLHRKDQVKAMPPAAVFEELAGLEHRVFLARADPALRKGLLAKLLSAETRERLSALESRIREEKSSTKGLLESKLSYVRAAISSKSL